MSCPHGFPTPGSCWDCMGDAGMGAAAVERETMERQLTARFPGECPECGMGIYEGDTIVLTSRRRYLHPRCCVGVLS